MSTKYTYGKDRSRMRRTLKKVLGIGSLVVGIVIVFYFFFPVISYHLFLSSEFSTDDIESPLPKRYVLQGGGGISSIFSSGLSEVAYDFKDARNWFPQVEAQTVPEQKISEYLITIPSQEIINAKVSADDFDLSQHLVQYFTTSKNPTDRGTSVIFGHSTLPQWFDPTNYNTIFARLHTIKVGEEIILTVNNMKYNYKIFSINITDSTDPNIFSQSFDNSYITLITCTPPGTVWKRLVVRASLTGPAYN